MQFNHFRIGLSLAFLVCAMVFLGCNEKSQPHVDLNPRIYSVTPASGPISGGTTLTIQGYLFQNYMTVKLGEIEARSTVVHSPSLITCTTPAGAAGFVDIRVISQSFVTATVVNGFMYIDPPDLVSISPAFAPSEGGGSLTLTGAGFRIGAQVTVGGIDCTNCDYSGIPSIIRCITPLFFAGSTADVTVTNPDGQWVTLPNALEFVPHCGVTGVSPMTGPMEGGTTITIFGTDFQANATVELNGVLCTELDTSGAPNRIVCATPSTGLPGPVDLVVTNHSPGDLSTTLANGFTYLAPGPPDVTSISPALGPLAGGSTVTLMGERFFDGALPTVFFGADPATEVTWVSTGKITCTLPAATLPGPVDVCVTNPDGQTDPTPVSYLYLAPSPPDVASIVPGSGPVGGGTSVTLTGVGFYPGTVPEVLFGTLAASNVIVGSGTQITCISPAASMSGPVNVTLTNPDGRCDPTPVPFNYVGSNPPDATGVSPALGPMTGGTYVVVTGSGFFVGSTPTMAFQGVAATSVTVVSSTTLVCRTPSVSTAGPAILVVTNPDGLADPTPLSFVFQAASPPTVSNVAPGSGPPAGGTPVTVFGTGFLSGASVAFNGLAATGVSVQSATTITCSTPANPGGTAAVTVTNPDNLSGVLYNAFTYTTILQISNVSPSSGPPSGGTAVTITGTLFQAGATVQFGGTPALNVTVLNATTISCTTPAHSAGVANVVVTNPDATFATLPGGFTYALPLTVANVLPSQAATGGGIPVTVNGMNFTAGCQVTFGQRPASDVNVVNSTQLTCILPWGVAGNVDVVVAHATGGAGTLTNGFTYVQNYVVRFDGSDDVIDCGTSTTMDGFSAATFEAWFRINQSTNYGAVFHRNGGGTSCYSVQTYWQQGQFSIHIPTLNFFYSNANLPLDKWIHIACVYTGTNMLMFINGKLDRQQAATGAIRSLATAKTYVGSENTAQNTFFNGWIDEARISNVARYSGNFAPPAMLTSDANTVLLLHMNEGSGTQATDASGLGNHGTLVNSPTWTAQDLGLQPAITGVTPNAGPGAGGTSIQISGQGFMAGAVVKVGGVYAKNIVIVDCTSITCDTPSGSLGFADIEVINPGDLTATFTNGFTYQ